jgi:hypothetical protein
MNCSVLRPMQADGVKGYAGYGNETLVEKQVNRASRGNSCTSTGNHRFMISRLPGRDFYLKHSWAVVPTGHSVGCIIFTE